MAQRRLGDDHPAAVAAVAMRADNAQAEARDRLTSVLDRSTDVADAVAGLLHHGRLTINFHPDRCDRTGRLVIEALLDDDRYHTQYETGISNGSRSALVNGGQRREFERSLFGELPDDALRPIYGTLDITHDPHGGAPSFGSCALVLADHVKRATTFTAGDSHLGPSDIGTADRFDAVAAAIFEGALARGLSVDDLVSIALEGPPECDPARDLANYVEAQIHRRISLSSDVVSMLVDPAFKDTPVATASAEIADRYEVELIWHSGSVADVDEIPSEFHGREAVDLGHELARADGTITAREIGAYASALPWEPQRPHGDPHEHPLQVVKYLWQGVLVWGRDLR